MNLIKTEADADRFNAEKASPGFITLMILSEFMVLLILVSAVMGCMSYMLQVMLFRNRMLQASRILAEDSRYWQEEVSSVSRDPENGGDYEKIVLTRNEGPYLLVITELRDKGTEKTIMNRLEFIPARKTDDRKS